jgi:hypothetical protein
VSWIAFVILDPIQPWWKGIWRALRPNVGRYGSYAELMLTSEDVRRVAEFIRQRLREPNAETAATIEAARRGDTVVVGDVDGLFAGLKSDDPR